MSGFRLGSDYLKRNFTLVDNEFLLGILPAADATDVKIYIFALALATDGSFSGTMADFALKLKLSPERVMDGFRFFEELGIISVQSAEPLDVLFRAVKAPVPQRAMHDLKKYASFQADMVELFPDKFLTPNDVVPFMELLHDSKMEPTAMLQIVQYCIRLKGEKVSTPYMLAVANNWTQDGMRTEKAVSERIDQMEAATTELLEVLVALGVKSQATLEDRGLYQTWRAKGFAHESILAAAKLAKKTGGTTKLDRILKDLTLANAFSPLEIETYRKELAFRRELSATLIKNIGGYYASLDPVIENYVLPWLEKGFTDSGLLLLSRMAFKRGVKTLEGLDALIQKFFRMGLVSAEGISAYIAQVVLEDEAIKELLETAGAARYVSGRDRDLYRVWQKDWGISTNVLFEAATLSKNQPYPMTYMNGILLNYRSSGTLAAPQTAKKKSSVAIETHDYKREELSSIFVDLSDPDSIEV